DACALGAQIIGVGADYSVLDGEGNEVEAGEANRPIAQKSPLRSSRTIMGMGAHMMKMAAETPEFKEEPQQLEDPGGFIGTDASIADGGLALGGKEEKIEFDDSGGFATGGFAAADSSIAQGAMEMDGSPQKINLDDSSGGFSSVQSSPDDGIAVPDGPDKVVLEGPGGFIATNSVITDGAVGLDGTESTVNLPIPPPVLVSPATEGFNLDALDADALMMLDGTDEGTEAESEETSRDAVSDASFMPPEGDELDMGALDIDEPTPTPHATEETPMEAALAPLVGGVTEVPAEAPVVDQALARKETADDNPVRSGTWQPTSSHSGEHAHPTAARPASKRQPARPRSSFVLLDGWFTNRPRIRVIIGFLGALLLASMLPICHARSIRTARIEELRIDLATAKAHGPTLAGNRTPAEIEGSISSLQTRHTIYALAMWCALMGLFLFLWFRFT
ncbi:MAG: hypothetical protein JRH20_04720, partial [Deltaproteobacteria bacterium]|nr:hypothetical protein [Deltaproteobacteria bacterium]